jgi:hypothetical protein
MEERAKHSGAGKWPRLMYFNAFGPPMRSTLSGRAVWPQIQLVPARTSADLLLHRLYLSRSLTKREPRIMGNLAQRPRT